jgi:hypothetical protein
VAKTLKTVNEPLKTEIKVALIGFAGLILAAIIGGVFSLHQNTKSFSPVSGDKAPTQAATSPAKGNENSSTGKLKDAHTSGGAPIPSKEPPRVEPAAAGLASPLNICDAGPGRTRVEVVLRVKPGADLYADNHICRGNISSTENMVIFLPQGTHHLVLKSGAKTCPADPTLPLPDGQPVIMDCQ